MPAPSGFENFRNVFVVVRSLPGDRLNIVNIFGLGQLALDDAAQRFTDTGGEYTVFNASGISEVDVLNVINNNIGGIASGVSSLIRFDLPLIGDDDIVNHTTINSIPVAEYDTAQASRWNLKTPVGGISGLVFDMSWFHEDTQTGEFRFSLITRQLPLGVNTSGVDSITSVMSETRTFTKGVLNTNEVKVKVEIPGLQDLSIELIRNDASLLKKVRAVSYGIIYKGSGIL